MQSVEQLMASQNGTTPLMPNMPEEERRAIIHDSPASFAFARC
jgi:hypothetical protein